MAQTRRYYSKVAGARYVFRDGTEVVFAHGFADISNSAYQEELNEILGKNPMIYVEEKLPEPLPKVQQNAVAEADLAAAEAALVGRNVRTAQEVGQVNVAAASKPSDVNASTVDPALKAELLSAASVSPAERARQLAAERAQASVASVSSK